MILRWLIAREREAKQQSTVAQTAMSGNAGAHDAAPRPRGSRRRRFLIWFLVISHVLGAITSVQAVMSTRTAQGAIAWAISLNTFPYVALPAYWVLGQSKFDGYHLLRMSDYLRQSDAASRAEQRLIDVGLFIQPSND